MGKSDTAPDLASCEGDVWTSRLVALTKLALAITPLIITLKESWC